MAVAETNESGALRQEIRELRQALERLDTRVQMLEQRGPAQSEPRPPSAATGEGAAVVTPHAGTRMGTLKQQWESVKRGMTVQEVERLLGRPNRTADMSPKAIWYYSYPDAGNGSVVFVQGTVIDWQSPPFNGWWGF